MLQLPDGQRSLEMLPGNLSRGTSKWRSFREHLPENNPKSIDIGSNVHPPVTELFWTCVTWSSQEHAGLRHGGVVGNLRGYFDKAEIDHLNGRTISLVKRDNEVSRFDIAVHKTSLMRRSQGGGDLDDDFQG